MAEPSLTDPGVLNASLLGLVFLIVAPVPFPVKVALVFGVPKRF